MLLEQPAWVNEQAAEIQRILGLYPQKRSAIMPLLHLAQDSRGYIHDDDIEAIADLIEETPSYVESVCSFYSMYHRKPKGRYHLVVCGNLSCGLGGSRRLIEALREAIGPEGAVTPDGELSFEVTAECLAACDQAPCLQCNGEYVVRCQPDKARELVAALRSGAGPQAFLEAPLVTAAPAVHVAEAAAPTLEEGGDQ